MIPVSLLLAEMRTKEYEPFECVACKARTMDRHSFGSGGVRIRVFLCAECEGDGDDAFMAWLKGQCAVIAASRDWSQVPGVAMVPEENIER